MADGIMVVAGNTSSMDAKNQDLKTMLINISSLLSGLETRKLSTSRRPERRFRHQSISRNSGNQELCCSLATNNWGKFPSALWTAS
ncbi:hypothetical protein NPIL_113071 [Nephila pilipes]|uniref:Uncharacterized protein n=1 Tax=Nephila pilipes TaxID=299642 RepID=A0A8X6UB54_NEPPI|nr:hypothetical protein NPIL_113071 [Nephila pilipes]